MSLFEYTVDENVAVLTMNNGENRFNFDFFTGFRQALDDIEKQTDANVLVVNSADEKIWSNGIDLDWLMPMVQKEGPAGGKKFMEELNGLLKHILLYPMITIASMNGHVFAGGAIMACAFDFRFMRTDRGFFCFPEVDLKIPFTAPLLAVATKAIAPQVFDELQYTGKRITATEAEELGVIKKGYHLDDLHGAVMEYAKTLNKDRGILTTLKQRMYKDIVRIIDEEEITPLETGN